MPRLMSQASKNMITTAGRLNIAPVVVQPVSMLYMRGAFENAAAMGKPTWVMVPKAADWRWMLDRNDSPWYPTMRLFRQKVPGAWDEVIADVVDALR